MRRELFLVSLLMLLSLNVSFAQWSGSLKTDGSWNFRQGNNETADFKLKYKGDSFYIGSNLFFGHSYTPWEQTTSILDAKKEKSEYYKEEGKEKNPRKFNAGAAIDFGYVFNPNDVLSASAGYLFSRTNEYSILHTERYNADRSTLGGIQKDTSYFKNHKINGKIAYNHKFDSRPRAQLDMSISGIIGLNADANRRIADGNFYDKPKNYATYSSLNNFKLTFSASYEDVFSFKKSSLKFKAGLDHISNQDVDGYFAETYVNGQWRDSTDYRQSYFYDSHSTEPYVNLSYSVGKFDIFVMERIQVYWHAMLDKLEDKTKPEDFEGLFDKYDVKNILCAGISYRINDRHRLMLDYGRSIARPDYKKLCPTLMIGNSEGEYFIGNPELLPEITDKINLGYSYTKGLFITKLDFNYRDRRNTAEKVIDLEKSKDVTDPGVKTIYTWINNKRQNSLGAKLDFKMSGKDVKAEIWAGFNYDIYRNGDKINKEDFNYEVGTSVDVFLNETTKLSSSLAYISARRSAYNLRGEDMLANLRFSKILAKGLDLYLEFMEIGDTDTYEETWNADMNYHKVSTTQLMLNSVVLGIKYVF